MTLTDAALAAEVAAEAGELLLAVREEIGFYDPYELGDAGDKRANTLILRPAARASGPTTPCSSEEAVDDLSRVDADRVWIVDPRRRHPRVLDARPRRLGGAHRAVAARPAATGGGSITDAAVALPAARRGVPHRHRDRRRRRAPTGRSASPPAPTGRPRCCGGSRDQLDVELVRIGSAGAKAMAVVRGDVDAYVHAGGQWEWDSAAPAGVVLAAGCTRPGSTARRCSTTGRDPYLPDLLMCRPELADVLLDAIRSAWPGMNRPSALIAPRRCLESTPCNRGRRRAFRCCRGGVRSCGSTTAPTGRCARCRRARPPPCTSAASPRTTPPTSATRPPT